MVSRPIIVCLCGSTKYIEAFRKANLTETLAGKIVLSIGYDMKTDSHLFSHLPDSEIEEIKRKLDELHLRKIDLADEVLFLNVDGYMGESTFNEYKYAVSSKKKIRFLEPNNIPEHVLEVELDKVFRIDKILGG